MHAAIAASVRASKREITPTSCAQASSSGRSGTRRNRLVGMEADGRAREALDDLLRRALRRVEGGP
jgi:hypothetical protein